MKYDLQLKYFHSKINVLVFHKDILTIHVEMCTSMKTSCKSKTIKNIEYVRHTIKISKMQDILKLTDYKTDMKKL